MHAYHPATQIRNRPTSRLSTMSTKERRAFNGPRARLVLAFDVGTTHSGISYTIMEPGEVPEICNVTRFLGQEDLGDSRVPTIIYYDDEGHLRAIGAETLQPDVLNDAESEGWHKAEGFKLHLHPRHLADIIDDLLPPLPPNKTVVDVLSDFLRYLHQCAREHIQKYHTFNSDRWQALERETQFVLSHPNSWRGLQQSQMRRAAVLGGLISDDHNGHSSLRFVTNGEACLHYFLERRLVPKQGVIVIDAGGGTVDLSTYRMITTEAPQAFEELASADSLCEGSAYVTWRAKAFLKDKLRGSSYSSPEQIDDIADVFDTSTKRLFSSSRQPSYIKFGAPHDTDSQFGIANGCLKLDGQDVATFFDLSVTAIIAAVEKQLVQTPVESILLVGGFGASSWLYSNLQKYFALRAVSICRPDDQMNKPVSNGAISFSIDNRVSARVSPFDYALYGRNAFYPMINRPADAGHIPDHLSILLRKGMPVPEGMSIERDFRRSRCDLLQLSSVSEDIFYYGGEGDDTKEAFKTLCTVTADTSEPARTLLPRNSPSGTYYSLEYKIILHFGLTELKAQVSWTENGVEQRRPATIVHFDDVDSEDQQGPELELVQPRGTFDCAICFENQSGDNGVHIDQCGHRFCKSCIRQYLSSALSERHYPITCPLCVAAGSSSERPSVITEVLARQIDITGEEREIWFELDMAMFSILIQCRKCNRSAFVDRQEHQESTLLLCPLPDCDNVWCKNCQQSNMVNGSQHSCDGLAELEQLMREMGWKYCPGCNTPVMKISGCNHMACTTPACAMHFCYVCGREIVRLQPGSGGNLSEALSAHWKICPQYS